MAIVALKTGRDECVQSVIDTLEECLADAKDGRIVAVALAVVRPDGSINTSRSISDDVGRLLGAMSLAQARMTRQVDE